MTFSKKDTQFMEEVFTLAKKGKKIGTDPFVGAIVVKGSKIIARGYHKTSGADHAEVAAFKKVKNKKALEDATLYTNLEPCTIYSRTPSCTDQTLKYKLKKVFISNRDPFPSVSGFGIRQLKRRGVQVSIGLFRKEGLRLNQKFFSWAKKQKPEKPYLKISSATSIDGKLVDISQKETLLSSKEDRDYKDNLRAAVDAIIVGGKTLLQDDPSLLIKDKKLRRKSFQKKGYPYPIKIAVIEKIPQDINLEGDFFNTHDIKRIIFTTSKTNREIIDTIEKKSYLNEIFVLGERRIDLKKALSLLAHFGIKRILVEGGGDLNYELIKAGLVDELEVRINSLILGGRQNPSIVFGEGFKIEDAPRPRLKEIKKIGDTTIKLKYIFK